MMNWRNLIETEEYVDFRNNYKKFVSKMNSREFAASIIKYGGMLTRRNIILMMKKQGIVIPKELLCEIKNNLCEPNYVELFFEYKNICSKTDLDKFNLSELYCEFKRFMFVEYDMKQIPIKKELEIYFNEQEEIENKIKSLTDLDCELMKMGHIM